MELLFKKGDTVKIKPGKKQSNYWDISRIVKATVMDDVQSGAWTCNIRLLEIEGVSRIYRREESSSAVKGSIIRVSPKVLELFDSGGNYDYEIF